MTLTPEERLDAVLDVLADMPQQREGQKLSMWMEDLQVWVNRVRAAAAPPEPEPKKAAWTVVGHPMRIYAFAIFNVETKTYVRTERGISLWTKMADAKKACRQINFQEE